MRFNLIKSFDAKKQILLDKIYLQLCIQLLDLSSFYITLSLHLNKPQSFRAHLRVHPYHFFLTLLSQLADLVKPCTVLLLAHLLLLYKRCLRLIPLCCQRARLRSAT